MYTQYSALDKQKAKYTSPLQQTANRTPVVILPNLNKDSIHGDVKVMPNNEGRLEYVGIIQIKSYG